MDCFTAEAMTGRVVAMYMHGLLHCGSNDGAHSITYAMSVVFPGFAFIVQGDNGLKFGKYMPAFDVE